MPFSGEPPEYLVASKYILPNITMKMPPPLQPWDFPSLAFGLLDRYFSKHSSVPVLDPDRQSLGELHLSVMMCMTAYEKSLK